MESEELQGIIDHYAGEKGALISVLQDLQGVCNYLPEPALRQVSDALHVPLSQVYSVASFYNAFSLKPRGRHHICVCLGTACHVRGAPRVLQEMERQLGIRAGDTTEDMNFTLESVNCVGACALGPVVVADGGYSGQMTARKVSPLLKTLGTSHEENQNDS
ncbi:MAG: NAD(P)H-dependent oxidoreductase subunit E [Armatimonadetes bacterium CG2_30_59_28]|nr:NAD(P)H-dependent oxidoreductase subunit E [Armatimonadota bacterium]OIO96426.1 MAG: NAD(P)H-dependent oxidoreductase subunit E [Armatimonadetes bacterium CG2_30_59_28]PIU66243.1 MAG: NAD(P)H-dependent oxidoreductase subunit E [Armatimonadetes bacterium CG07_land_8_20_14_0_80_59_28]PIX45073.1 MAG: NAD(P)H-dependent oxidoreductase subunit E [Armatimonadetes bacterium CG_4_8_14_3_um_filter_58_9]PIY43809.1 MAG: NAD(P)H-dependent oxidoreductase subunit E [Armatimonadetes bacterium CG_4_10_14_3_u